MVVISHEAGSEQQRILKEAEAAKNNRGSSIDSIFNFFSTLGRTPSPTSPTEESNPVPS